MKGSYKETLLKRHRVCFAILGDLFLGNADEAGHVQWEGQTG